MKKGRRQGLAQTPAGAIGTALESPHGMTWVRLRALSPARNAESGGPIAAGAGGRRDGTFPPIWVYDIISWAQVSRLKSETSRCVTDRGRADAPIPFDAPSRNRVWSLARLGFFSLFDRIRLLGEAGFLRHSIVGLSGVIAVVHEPRC